MDDLTIIYLTNNNLGKRWVEFQLERLHEAIDGCPITSISREPMDLGQNLIQTEPPSCWNVYKQVLRGAYQADTEYVAIAEDDTLYTPKHFSEFRPAPDEIAYDASRWSLFAWQKDPMFSCVRKHGNFTMIGPTKLVIEALKERMDVYPNGHKVCGEIGRPDVERKLNLTPRKLVEWWCTEPIVNVAHERGLSPTYVGVPGLKRKPGPLKAFSIPYWGSAYTIVDIFNDGYEEAGNA